MILSPHSRTIRQMDFLSVPSLEWNPSSFSSVIAKTLLDSLANFRDRRT